MIEVNSSFQSMRIVLLVALILFAMGSAQALSLWPVISDQLLLSAAPDNFAKLEIYSYNDTSASIPTYIICIAALSTSGNGGQVHLEKRRYVVGETGIYGPDLITVDVQFDDSKTYKDIDISDGTAECIFAALSTDDQIYIGTGKAGSLYFQTTSGARNQIEIVSDESNNYIFTMNAFWFLPSALFGSPNLFSFGDSQESIRLKNGVFVGLGATSGSSTISLRTSDGADTSILNFYGGRRPSAVGWSDNSFLTCGECDNQGIVCGRYPGGPDNVITRAKTATQTVSWPVLSLLDPANDVGILGLMMYDSELTSTYYELRVVDKSGNPSLVRTKIGSYMMRVTAQDSYIFAVYADSNGLYLDTLFYGETAPILPPVAPPQAPAPVSEPVAEPVADTPTTAPLPDQPSSAPESTPIDSTPVNAPLDVPIAGPTAKNETLNPATEVGADVLGPAIAIPGAAVVGTALFLLLYLRKRKQNKDKSDDGDKSDDTKRQTVEPSNYATIPSRTSVSGYGAIPDGGRADTDTFQGINPTSIHPSEVDKRMQIPYKSLFFAREIGAGSYGKVFQGEWRGAQVAIKVNNQIADTDGFLAEAKLTLGIAPHPNLVQTFGVSLDGPNPCIVLEFCGGGSLDSVMHDKEQIVTNETKRSYALKIAYGLLHLHNNNIVHRDLAARNILLANDGTPKISDFGMSRIIQDEGSKGKTKATIGPLRWMAPESLRDRIYSVKSDVWSYGILVWEIVSRNEPHENEDQLMIGAKIRDSAYTPTIPDECDPTLAELLKMCWRADPTERPTMEEIIEHLRSNQD
jgi:predicted Ser/Thr protein kinase